MPIRITGLNSGLDTEAIISALVSSYNYKTDKYKKAQTKLSWKQDAWKSLNTKIYSLYTSVGNLRLSSAYNLRTATVSDTTKMTVAAGSSSVNGSYSVQITKLAKAGYLTGGRLASGTTASAKLSDLGYSGGEGTISLTTGGVTNDVKVTGDTTIQEVINQLKEAGVNASYDETNRRFYVSAKESGKDNDFSLSAGNADGQKALEALGLNASSAATTAEYAELATYANLSDAEIKAISQAKTAANTQNDALKQTNVYLSNIISYTKASKAINEVSAKGSAADADLLKELATKSSLENTYVDADNNVYTYDSESDKYVTYKKLADGSQEKVEVDKATAETYTKASDKLNSLAESFGLITDKKDDGGNTVKDTSALDTFRSNLATVVAVSSGVEASESDEYKNLLAEADAALKNTANADAAANHISSLETKVEANETTIAANNATIAANSKIGADWTDEQVAAFMEKAAYAKDVTDGTITPSVNATATRVNGEDATIYVNGAEYTGTSNTFSINGLTITATGVTGDAYDPTGTNAVTATVNTDTQGIYDKIKDFLTQYNALINEMTSLYNAESAKGYEPLTDEEKDALSDTEVEKWEEKIKGSLLRRDDTLQSLINTMTTTMSKGVKVDGETLYLSNFGIKTLGYFTAPDNEENAYHIDGDEDDAATSGNADKLMAAIANDPEQVMEFMQGLTKNLYDAVGSKMKATTLRSTYTVYNDKEMASEYSDYTDLINKWQEKLEKQEEYYYNKFSAMETALSKLNSQSSSLTGLLG